MKLKIWNEESTKCEDDNQLFIKLEEFRQSNDIALFVCDKKGEKIDDGNLLAFDQDEKFMILCVGINDKVPFKTDIDGALLFLTDEEAENRRKNVVQAMMMREMGNMLSNKEQEETKEKAKH